MIFSFQGVNSELIKGICLNTTRITIMAAARYSYNNSWAHSINTACN